MNPFPRCLLRVLFAFPVCTLWGANIVFEVGLPLIPRAERNLGTLSPWDGVTPVVRESPDGAEQFSLPVRDRNRVDLFWVFWDHTRPAKDQWPAGGSARLAVTLQCAREVTLTPRVHVYSGEWTEAESGAPTLLRPGEPTRILLPLPGADPEKAVERIRITFSADRDLPELQIRELAVGNTASIVLNPVDTRPPPERHPLVMSGRAAPGAGIRITASRPDRGVGGKWDTTADGEGHFEVSAPQRDLSPGPYIVQASFQDPHTGITHESRDVPMYIYPALSTAHTLPPVTREGQTLKVDGEPWAFLGMNYTRFLLGFSIRGNHRDLAEDFRQYGDWGIRVLRVPLHLGMFQPRPGIFPDHPRYAEILQSHGLEPDFFRLFEYAVAAAGHYGIRLVIDWHEMPVDPYRYFVGGREADRGTDTPGTGIAWLYDADTGKAAMPGDSRHTRALADTNRWLARYFKGNGNIFAFEVPYNEPHGVTDSTDLDWRKIVVETLEPILAGDPERLTFAMPPAWGHNNVLLSATWLPPDRLTGMTPHHYLANGPVRYREDAQSRPYPWLAREVAPTFEYAFAAMALPHSAVDYPVWNGESGEHGYSSFLPDKPREEAAGLMLESQIVQAYAAGWAGNLGWTLTGHDQVYHPVRNLYEQLYRRFAPVYAAGPIDRAAAEVLFVQNPSAVPVHNGLNHACIPFARLALDLHLAPVHYMTDAQLLATALIQLAVGLEQVEQASGLSGYRAAVVDTRNLDPRALDLLRNSGLPVLVVEDAAAVSADQLREFLGEEAEMELDERTPSALQLIEGPSHLLIYRRSGEGGATAHPLLKVPGTFSLIDEREHTVFTGDADTLAEQGLEIDLPRWRTAIFRIKQN